MRNYRSSTRAQEPFWRLSMFIIVAGLVLCATSARAQNSDSVRGVYLGVQYGVVDYFTDSNVCDELLEEIRESAIDENDDDVSSTVAQVLNGANCDSDGRDNGLGIFAGYRFNRNAAVELGYVDLGTTTAMLDNTTRVDGARLDAEGDVSLSASGLMASLLLSVPLGDHVSIFGRLGVLSWDADLKATAEGSIRIGGRSIRFSDLGEETRKKSGTDGAYGGGIRFAMNENLALRAEVTRFEVIDVNSGWLGLEISLR